MVVCSRPPATLCTIQEWSNYTRMLLQKLGKRKSQSVMGSNIIVRGICWRQNTGAKLSHLDASVEAIEFSN